MAKILVVDDMEEHRHEIVKVIGGQYTVLDADGGLSGLEQASTNSDIKLFILDYHMPDLNGIELARRIRGLGDYAKASIIIYTTETSDELIEEGRQLGNLVWVLKPMNHTHFEHTVRKLVQRVG